MGALAQLASHRVHSKRTDAFQRIVARIYAPYEFCEGGHAVRVREWRRAPSYRVYKPTDDPMRWLLIAEKAPGANPPGPIYLRWRQEVELDKVEPPAFAAFANLARAGTLLGGRESAEAFAQACVRFAKTYGLLGLGRAPQEGVFGPATDHWPDRAEREWIRRQFGLDARTDVERLSDWDVLAHNFYEALVATGLRGAQARREQAEWLWHHRQNPRNPAGLELGDEPNAVEKRQKEMAAFLEAHAHVRISYQWDAAKGFVGTVHFDTLVEFMAYHAITSLRPEGKPRAKPVKVCQAVDCGRIFEASHGNMRYCPECARKLERERKGNPERARFRSALARIGLAECAPEGSPERETLYRVFQRGGVEAMLQEARRLRLNRAVR